MERDYLSVLRSEFEAEEGSFLLRLRCEPMWDPIAFERLTEAILTACRELESEERLERWMAQGFWYVSWFVRSWSSHLDFPRPLPPEYYERAYQRLDDLAFWFFQGESPYEGDTGFEPLQTAQIGHDTPG